MKFKYWFSEYGLGSGVSSSLSWAGFASDGETNRGFPVKSKWSSKDGSNNGDRSGNEVNADSMFGFKLKDKKKRKPRDINKDSIKPKRVDVPDIIY